MASGLCGVDVVMLWTLLIGSCRAQLKAGCKLDTLRACGDDFLPYAKKTQLESSGDEMKRSCEEQNKQITCGAKFVDDCMEGLTKAIALPVADGFKRNVEHACNETLEEHEQKTVSCMNTAGEKLNSCWKTLREDVQKAVIKAPTNQVVFYTCCSFYDMVSCANQSLTPCESSSSRQQALDSLFGVYRRSQSMVCGNYTEGSQACEALPKLPDLDANDRKIENYIELLAETAIAVGRTKSREVPSYKK